jgi:ABC-type polysaccharide/polyol phosphate export permease
METLRVVTHYDSAAATHPALRELADLVRYRDLLRLMVVNIAKSRYKRSVLGVLWTLMNPLLHMTVLTIAFASIFSTSLPNYPVYVLSGLVCWTFFTGSTVFAMNSLIWGGSLIKRVYIPRTIFAAAAVGNGLTSLALSLAPLALVMVVVGHTFSWSLLALPLAILLLAAFTAGVALLVSSIAILFSDFVEFYQVMVQALFFLTPIMYPVEILPEWARAMLGLNPMYHLISVFRAPVYYGQFPDPATLGTAAATSAVMLALGWVAFTRRADELPYRI